MPGTQAAQPRSRLVLALVVGAGLALFALFAALGAWQLERRTWKLQLIDRVEQRLQRSPTPLPPPGAWAGLSTSDLEYQPITARGRWLGRQTVLTQATTALGAGWWVLTPLALEGGGQVLVNRGFIPAELRGRWSTDDPLAQAAGTQSVQVTGLLRASEPGGGFLRKNDPAAGRWHSRDVPAIAQAAGLAQAAPFFIDAGLPDASVSAAAPQVGPAAGPWPRPGLTVVRFHNSHLVYVLTWWGLAALVAGGLALLARHELRLRARQPGPATPP
ncbi:SURF1 family protein [Melaminivora sp.]|uniref:SURF1 family protein n=1 Tax=Melaminivora sp. TaxID=1933032 RepID=UPI0028AF6FD7|nr:SURF1 family cytochrome oxidase biogenesis protein [Melaminivora sp.]